MAVADLAEYTPDVVATAYKYFLGHAPERVLDDRTSLSLFSAWVRYRTDPPACVAQVARVLETMRPAHRTLLTYVVYLATQVAAHREANLMTERNLAILLSPLLFTLPKPEMFQGLNVDNNTAKETEQAIAITAFIIAHYAELFAAPACDVVTRPFTPAAPPPARLPPKAASPARTSADLAASFGTPVTRFTANPLLCSTPREAARTLTPRPERRPSQKVSFRSESGRKLVAPPLVDEAGVTMSPRRRCYLEQKAHGPEHVA